MQSQCGRTVGFSAPDTGAPALGCTRRLLLEPSAQRAAGRTFGQCLKVLFMKLRSPVELVGDRGCGTTLTQGCELVLRYSTYIPEQLLT